MAKAASERLLERVRPLRSGEHGISIETIARLSLTEDIVADISECLGSKDSSEIKWGLWFAAGVLDSNPPTSLLLLLVRELPRWIVHEQEDIRELAVPLLIRLRRNFRNYRSMMVKCLRDTSPEVRINALAEYSTFLTKKDIPLLLEFQHDDYMSETSMNSPLVYPIRNQALAIIEVLCGHKFPKHENVKVLEDGHTVYWWDWKPFLEWWARRRKSRRLWDRIRGRT